MKILGAGPLEIIIILVVVLLIFGPKNLPKLTKAIGKSVKNLREGLNAGKKEKSEAAADVAAAAEGVSVAEEPAAAAAVAEIEAAAEVVEEPAAAFAADGAAAETPRKVKRVVRRAAPIDPAE